MVEEAEKAAVYCAWEDLHWVDPSTLDVLTLFLDQAPTARILTLLTFRPEFTPPWGPSYFSQLDAQPLRAQTGRGDGRAVTSGKALPAEVVQQIVAKTDGVPLFVEELTKNVIEAVGATGRSPLQFTIPATLQDSLMARLDRLGSTKEIAQLGATIGREFTYELLAAVSSLDEDRLQKGLKQLVERSWCISGVTAAGDLSLQACPHPRHGLSIVTEEHPPAVSSADCSGVGGAFQRTQRPSPSWWPITTPRQGSTRRPFPTGSRPGSAPPSAQPIWKLLVTSPRGWKYCKTLPDTPERIQQELTLQIALG